VAPGAKEKQKTNAPNNCQYLPNWFKLKAVTEKCCTSTSVYLKETQHLVSSIL